MQNAAQRVIQKCGGFRTVAAMLGVDVSRVHRWTYPKARGGTDGKIPHAHQDRLMELARAKGIKLRYADFFQAANGADRKAG